MAYDTISTAAGPLNPAYAWLYSGARIGSLKYLVMADDIITTPSTPHVPPNSPTNGTQLSLSHWKRSSRRVGRMAGLVNSKFNKKTRMAANNQARSQSARDKRMAAEEAGRLKEDIAEWEQWRARVLAGRPPDPPFLFPLRSLPPFAQASLSVESVTTVPKEYPELSPTECTSHSQVFSYSTLYSLSCESTSGNHASRSSSLERCRAPSPRSTRPNLVAAAPPPSAASPLHYKSCLMTPSPLMSPPPSPPRSPSPHSLYHAFTSNPPPQLRPVADRRWSSDRMADKRRSMQDVKSRAGSHSPSRMTFNDSSSLSPALHEIMSSPAWRSQRVTLGQDREDKPSFTLPDPHRVNSSRNAKLARNKGDGHHVFRGLSQESIELKEEEINYAVECIRQTKQNKIKQKMQRFSKWAEDKDKGIAQKIIEILSNAGDSAKLVGSEVSTKRVERSSKEINVRRSGSNEMQEVQKEKSLQIRKSLDSIQITQTRFTGSCENPISQTTASLSNVSQSQGYPVDETETLYSKIDSSIPGDATQNTGNCYKQHNTSRSWSSPFLVTDKKCKVKDTKINTHDVYNNDKDTNVTNNGESLQQTDNSLVDEVAIDSKGWELKTNTPYPGTNEILNDSVNMNALTTEIETNDGKMPENDNFGSKPPEWIYRPHGPNYVDLYNSNKQTTIKRKMPIKTILKKPTVCVRNITIEQSANILKGKIFQSNNGEIIPVRDSLKSRLKALLGKDDPSQVHTTQHNVPSSNSSKSGIQAKPLTTEPTIRQLHPKNKTKGQAQTETIVQRVVLNNSLTPTKRILNYRCSTDSSHTHDDSTNISRSLNNEETVSGPTNLDSNINDVEEEIKVYEFSPQASNDEYFPNEWNLPQIQVDQKVVGKRSQVTVKSASHTCPTPHNTCVSLSSSDIVNFENVEPVNASPPTQENIILQNNNEDKLQQDATSSSIHTPNVRVKPTTASTTSTMESLFTSEDSNTLYSLSLNSGVGNYNYWPGTVNAGGVCNKSCIKTKQYNTPYCPNKTGFIATSEECDKNFTVSEPPFSTQYARANDGVQWTNGCDNIGQYGTNTAKELLADYTSYGFMDPMSRNEPFENAPVINSYGTNELTNYLDELTTTATYFPRSSTFPDESHAEVFHFPEHVCQSSAGTLPGPNYQTVTANSEDLMRGAVYSPAEHSNVSHTFHQGYSFDTSKEQEDEFWAREDENSDLSGDTSQCLLKYNTENDTLIRGDLDKNIVKSNAENSLFFNIGSPKFLKTIHSDKELSLTQSIKRHPDIHQFIRSPGHGPKEQEVLFMNTLHPVDKSPTPSWESAMNSDIENKEVRASTRSALERKTKSASNHSKHSNRISGRSIPKEFSWSSSTNQQPHTSASSEFLSYLENDTELMGKGDGVSIRESKMSAQNKRKHLSPSITRTLPRPFSTEDDLFLTKKTRLEWVATPLRPATCPDRVRKESVGNKNRLPKNTSEIGTSPRTPPEESKANERPSSKTIGPKGSFSVRSSKSPQGKGCKKSGSRASPKSRGSTMSGKGRSRELRSAKSSKDRKSESDGDSVTSTRRRHCEAERVSESSEWSLLDSAMPDFSELKLTWSSWDAFRDEPANLNEIQQYRNATRKAWRLMGRGDEASSGKTRTPVFPSSRSKKTNPPLQVNNFGTSNSCVEYLKKRLEQEEARLLSVMGRRRSTNASTNTATLLDSSATIAPSALLGPSARSSFAGSHQWTASGRARRPPK